jgi:hypothetical protein
VHTFADAIRSLTGISPFDNDGRKGNIVAHTWSRIVVSSRRALDSVRASGLVSSRRGTVACGDGRCLVRAFVATAMCLF